jgi:hypothetical protein
MVTRSVVFAVGAMLGLLALRVFAPDGMYDLGHHGRTLSTVSKATIILIALTHVVIASIMWTHRREWTPSEASMFRFMAVKMLFWGYLGLTVPITDRGISLVSMYLLVLLLGTTVDLDVKLFYRYVLGSEEGHRDGVLPTSPAWPVVERRRIPFGRRWSDKKGTP